MIEKLTDETRIVLVPDRDAQFYLDRLFRLSEFYEGMTEKERPYKYYNGLSLEWDDKGPGLLWGINHAIFGSLLMLEQLGYGLEARAIVGFKDHG